MSAPVVAAFDFDGTLTSGGSVWRYLAALTGPTKVLRAGAAVAPRLVRALLVGGTAADEAKEALFSRTLAGLDEREVRERSRTFGVEHYRRHARADVRARLEWHRRLGHRIVIVSASPALYVDAVGEVLDADAVVATRLDVDADGLLTGHYDGGNCRGEQKALRLHAWIVGESGLALPAGDPVRVWAYGNSAGDRHLLAAADTGVDVGRLGRFGKLGGFPRLADVAPDGDHR
ncbi:MAG TPA: HAD-IB family hydrolase, partial [Acidimicrobiales bacterium]|nr:HAD-IB family hydrolase [Acidimicrobiales bacterium]